jgi:hypothetical protein
MGQVSWRKGCQACQKEEENERGLESEDCSIGQGEMEEGQGRREDEVVNYYRWSGL